MPSKRKSALKTKQTNHTTLITEIEHEQVGVILSITHTYDSPGMLLDAIRQFVKKWTQTQDGKQAYAESCDDFNWGDFADWGTTLREKIPGVIDIVVTYPSSNSGNNAVIVDHDELLMDESRR